MTITKDSIRSLRRTILISTGILTIALFIASNQVSSITPAINVHPAELKLPKERATPPPVYNLSDKLEFIAALHRLIEQYHTETSKTDITFSKVVHSHYFGPMFRLTIHAKVNSSDHTYWCDFTPTIFGEFTCDIKMLVSNDGEKYNSSTSILENELLNIELSDFAQQARGFRN